MNHSQSIHCSKCGRVIEYPIEKEGATGWCPDCDHQVWYSQLSEDVLQGRRTHRSDRSGAAVPSRGPAPSWWAVGMLGFLVVCNLLLGYMVIGLRGQVGQIMNGSTSSHETAEAQPSLVVMTQGSKPMLQGVLSRQGHEIALTEALSLLHGEMVTNLDENRIQLADQSSRLEHLMEASSDLNIAIEIMVEEVTNLAIRLEQLSNDFSGLDEQQTSMQEGSDALD
ncbi:hypothetical protein OAE97_02090 [Verrucomicrobia bacterium]|jgi:hypothetical protein|nr:hypothetical protein [Verrucomicrobiota bacterium]MDG1891444.1 hypothetical protein [Verrucomicrobiota bacterium]